MPRLRLALRSLTRNKIGSTLCFVAIGAGAFLASIPEQIQSIIFDEIYSNDTDQPIPSLFLFDIQPHQTDALVKFLVQEKIELENLSPMVRAKLTHLNGQVLKKQKDKRFQRRNVNLSYHSKLSKSTKLVEGELIQTRYDASSGQLPKISLSEEYAKEKEIKIGDRLKFDVQGLPIEGKVANFRKVLWTSFRPNFFISFQAGVLEDAPQTYVGVISSVPENQRTELQHRISEKFTNIAALDISKTIADISARITQITWALRAIASVTFIVGLIVLFAIAQSEAKSRNWEVGLLKALGASPHNVRMIIYGEFGILCSSAILIGIFISTVIAQVISWFVFEKTGSIAWQNLTINGVTLLAFSLFISAIAVSQSLRQVPLKLLRSV